MADVKNTKSSTGSSQDNRSGGSRGGRSDQSQKGRGRGRRDTRPVREFEQKILDLARVTRVTAGGKRMSFRCALVIGDKKGKVGLGVAKGADVQIAIEKAYKQAKKSVISVQLKDETIPHHVWLKFGSALVLIKPAPKGTGLKSGGAIRMILEFAGIPNAVSKIVNSSNKINIAKATMEALKELRVVEESSGEEKDAKKPKKAADNV
ncbi:30S ribosomal protein S5 [Candidatus Uhrbacteria bacterium]|nr:30S ribosomal protein S5 [Candidatus Uhrbacteria bacterium]